MSYHVPPLDSRSASGSGATSTFEHDTSKPLRAFVAAAARENPTEFASRYGRGFLVRWIYDGDLDAPAALGSREWRKNTSPIAPGLATPPKTDGPMTPEAFFAYPLVFEKPTLQLGRAHTCAVCIGDMSVSTIHADLEWGDHGLIVTDRGSTNGTWVADHRIEFGESAAVEFGKTLRVGQVKLTFMTAASFIDFIKLLA